MNKRQSRIFAIVATGFAAIAFIGLTLHSHTRFGELTNAQNITPQVTQGKDVWHKYNCINCHTLFGEGAYYAPDLTKITQHRGEAYLKAYMRDPSRFYDENRHRRLMPTQNLSDEEIDHLIQFLDWVANVDNQGWPPRPILVTGGFTAVAGGSGAGTPAEARPRSACARWTRTTISAPSVKTCSVPPSPAAPPATRWPRCRWRRSQSGWRGDPRRAAGRRGGLHRPASDVEGYLREAITEPSAHLNTGGMYSANGVSFMPNTYGDSLSDEEIEQLVAFLATLK